MSFFGFKSSREAEEEKRQAVENAKQETRRKVVQDNYTNLSNLSKGSQINFAIPYFDVFDPRLQDYGVPVAVHGTLVYQIDDMDLFHQLNKNEGYSDETFQNKLRGVLTKYIKAVVTNAPIDNQIPLIQMERKILDISELVQNYVTPKVEKTFGIVIRSLDITNIIVDKMSRGYRELKELTADLEKERVMTQHNAQISNFNLQNSLNQDTMQRQHNMQLGQQEELQDMDLENRRETMRIQREEMQRASRLQTEQTFLGAHKANLDAGVMNNAVDNGINAFHQQGMGAGMSAVPQMGMPQMPGTKAVPQVQYFVGVNGQQAGPFNWQQLQQLVAQGQLTQQTYVWKQGMPQWQFAGQVQELQPLFASAAPQMPGMPPQMPGM
jgi:hypothetical protein